MFAVPRTVSARTCARRTDARGAGWPDLPAWRTCPLGAHVGRRRRWQRYAAPRPPCATGARCPVTRALDTNARPPSPDTSAPVRARHDLAPSGTFCQTARAELQAIAAHLPQGYDAGMNDRPPPIDLTSHPPERRRSAPVALYGCGCTCCCC